MNKRYGCRVEGRLERVKFPPAVPFSPQKKWLGWLGPRHACTAVTWNRGWPSIAPLRETYSKWRSRSRSGLTSWTTVCNSCTTTAWWRSACSPWWPSAKRCSCPCRTGRADASAPNAISLWFACGRSWRPNEEDFGLCGHDAITLLCSRTTAQLSCGLRWTQQYTRAYDYFDTFRRNRVKTRNVQVSPCWDAMCNGVSPSPSDSLMMKAPFSESSSRFTMLYLPYLAPKCNGLSPLWFLIFTHAPSCIRLSRLLIWPPLLA